jgi:two-component system sensor histidine kinase ChvG
MTTAPKIDAPQIDVRDLKSVRRAARAPDIVLGEDWVDGSDDAEKRSAIARVGFLNLRKSPLARKIVMFNLVAMTLMIAGLLYLNSSRDSLVYQRASGLVREAQLIANVFQARLPVDAPADIVSGQGIDATATLAALDLRGGIEVAVFAPDATFIDRTTGPLSAREMADLENRVGQTFIIDTLGALAGGISGLFGSATPAAPPEMMQFVLADDVIRAAEQGMQVSFTEIGGSTGFVVLTPVLQNGVPVAVVAVTSAAGEVDGLVRRAREEVLRLFFVGMAVSIGLSLVLASTIANPLADLAAAAETSHDRNARRMSPLRVRIPDLTARPDEIGRLSGALRSMVSALYDRIDSNEQFAADVAHEIKNPLASLRSAVGTLRVAKRDDQRDRLLGIIDHDVRRLDRLVSDIANASRLDSELVKEEEEFFDLNAMLRSLLDHLGREAKGRGVDFVTDIPSTPMQVRGLEGRLAQVIVNLVSNAVSFCEKGDAIRVWTRSRDNRVLVVVEDTGPGIPETALKKIFQRFYSERPEGQFGNNSGLGLAISKQIVEAHGGVIWAENIRPTHADPTSEPAGARFVVGLPL